MYGCVGWGNWKTRNAGTETEMGKGTETENRERSSEVNGAMGNWKAGTETENRMVVRGQLQAAGNWKTKREQEQKQIRKRKTGKGRQRSIELAADCQVY